MAVPFPSPVRADRTGDHTDPPHTRSSFLCSVFAYVVPIASKSLILLFFWIVQLLLLFPDSVQASPPLGSCL